MYCERLQRLSDGAIRACTHRVAPTAIERSARPYSFVFEVTLKAPHDAASPAGADDAGARLGDATAVGKSPRRPRPERSGRDAPEPVGGRLGALRRAAAAAAAPPARQERRAARGSRLRRHLLVWCTLAAVTSVTLHAKDKLAPISPNLAQSDTGLSTCCWKARASFSRRDFDGRDRPLY